MNRRFALVALLALCASCSDALSPESKLTELDAARRKWAQKGFPLYLYTMRRVCFCINTNPLDVSVSNGKVVQVYDQTQQKTVDLAFGQTVEQLFEFVDSAIRNGAATIDVSYDAALGFPIFINYDGSRVIADDELTITAGNMLQGAVVH
jgi:hypothetical protein